MIFKWKGIIILLILAMLELENLRYIYVNLLNL